MNVKESKRDKGLKKRSKKQSKSSDCDSSASRKPDAKKRNKKKSSSSDSDSDDKTVKNVSQVSSDDGSKPRTSKNTKKRIKKEDMNTIEDNQINHVEKSRSGIPGILKQSTSTIAKEFVDSYRIEYSGDKIKRW